jgi:uncharacterized membrane protein
VKDGVVMVQVIVVLVLVAAIGCLVLLWMNKAKDKLYRNADRRMDGLWIGQSPSIVEDREIQVGDVLFCSPHVKKGCVIRLSTSGVYRNGA